MKYLREGGEIVTKEQFNKRMELIQNFHSEQETLQVLIDKLTDGYSVVDMGNYLVEELVNIITEELHIKDKDLLFWWLYEDVEKIIYNGEYRDQLIIEGETIEEIKEKTFAEVDKRGWERGKCWSRKIDD